MRRAQRLLLLLLVPALAGCALPEVRTTDTPDDEEGQEGLRGPLLHIDVIDVGQGDAILLRSPAGKTLLFDTGPRARAADLLAHLRDTGVTRIDTLVLSHAHEDHYGAAVPLIEAMPIARVYEPGLPSDRAPWRATVQALEARSVPIFTSWTFAPGDRIPLGDPALNATLLWPLGVSAEKEPAQQGIVLRIEYGNFSMLLPGDINGATEQQLVAAGLGRTTVVAAPHHGSAYSSSHQLVQATQPALVIVSAGAGNEYGHPAPGTVERWEMAGAQVLRTDKAGTVRLLADGMAWSSV